MAVFIKDRDKAASHRTSEGAVRIGVRTVARLGGRGYGMRRFSCSVRRLRSLTVVAQLLS